MEIFSSAFLTFTGLGLDKALSGEPITFGVA
jgi:hypothetical protein